MDFPYQYGARSPKDLFWTADLSCVTSQIASAREVEGKAKLLGLMKEFDPNDDQRCWRVRDLLATNPRGFYAGAQEVLASPDDTPATRFLVILLSESDLFIRSLCDPAIPRDRAVAIARRAAKRDPMIDVMLARYLTDRVDSISPTYCPVEFHRMLGVLSEIADGVRILPFLMTLARQNNPALHSKAVLLIGRVTRNVKWAQTRLAEPDHRVRANTIEALWGVDTPDIRELLRSAIQDTDNRVAGNALLGLYRLGDPSTIPELFQMAVHESPRFRATAAWVMGEAGDPRFVKALGRMLGESNALVRTRAFSALGRVKAAAVIRARPNGDWVVTADFGDTSFSPTERRLFLQVRSVTGGEIAPIPGTQVTITEDSEPVVEYSLEDRGVLEQKSLIFLFPWSENPSDDPWRQALRRCYAWRRFGDFLSVLYYGTVTPDQEPLRFVLPPAPDDPAAPLQPPPRAECPEFKTMLRRAVAGDHVAAHGKRHIIVVNLSEAPAERTGYEQLLSAVKQSRAVVHVASTSAHADLENVSQWSEGHFRVAPETKKLRETVLQLYLELTARYSAVYKPVVTAPGAVTVSVCAPTGVAETVLPFC